MGQPAYGSPANVMGFGIVLMEAMKLHAEVRIRDRTKLGMFLYFNELERN